MQTRFYFVGLTFLVLAIANVISERFPEIHKPYECESPGDYVQVDLNQHFITADPQPVSWKMYLHPQHEDVHVSASIYYSGGNAMFEMHIKERIYKYLRGTVGGFDRPKDPLFLDVGANIGKECGFYIQLSLILKRVVQRLVSCPI